MGGALCVIELQLLGIGRASSLLHKGVLLTSPVSRQSRRERPLCPLP